MHKQRRKIQNQKSQLQEKRAAKEIQGSVVSGSGAPAHSGGGDVRRQGEVRVECKQTRKPFFVVTLDMLKKIRTQAIKGGLEAPVLHLQFLTPQDKVLGEFAFRPHIPHAEDNTLIELTNRKRVRLHHSDLVRATAEGREGVIGFHKNRDQPIEYWDVLRWGDFLSRTSRYEDEEE